MRVDAHIHGRPCPGETESGDAGGVQVCGEVTWVLLIDALGHGPEAAKVGVLALDELARFDATQSVEAALLRLGTRLHGSRGAAAALLRFDPAKITVAGIGNVELRTLSGDPLPYVPAKGILGRRVPRLRSHELAPLGAGRLLMFTDGIERRAPLRQLSALPGPQMVETLIREHAISRDDAMAVHVDYRP